MVGVVIISHSHEVAESIVQYTKMMAKDAHAAAAGGLEDGSFGTSFEKIYAAINAVYSDDGVILIMDMGSAVMTAEMVLEAYGSDKIMMADCPILEGAVVATICALGGMAQSDIMEALQSVGTTAKF